ncbi:HAD family hydrolase [Jannaschia sp. R86511]|uniref:HAD family hydrolase n=1 Tax=Jannaschia sp. R86511 TaxID=3093853 RepID=UPI0036D27D57
MTKADRVLLLWDVDHTLIDSGGVSKINYARAFELLVGRPPAVPARTGGRTDVLIMSTLLAENGISEATFSVNAQLSALARAGATNRTLLGERGRALPGAHEALHVLQSAPDIIQSVLTGNIQANAFVKLDTFGLADALDFSVGAFGHESSRRADLVPVAQRKAEERYAFVPVSEATVILGDTTRDVEAGLQGGAQVIGVATGGVSVVDLRSAGAVAAIEDLRDLEGLIRGIEDARSRGAVNP